MKDFSSPSKEAALQVFMTFHHDFKFLQFATLVLNFNTAYFRLFSVLHGETLAVWY